MPNYLPWTDSDLESIERALKRYKTAGREASFDLDRHAEGVVTVSQVDPTTADAPIVIFEIHKFERTGSTGRAHFVVQVQSIDGKSQALKQHGAFASSILIFAIAKAEQDLHNGFVGRDSFDMATNSYWLK